MEAEWNGSIPRVISSRQKDAFGIPRETLSDQVMSHMA